MNEDEDEIPGAPTRRERIRRTSQAHVDLVAVLLEELRHVAGVEVAGSAEASAKAAIKRLCDKFFQMGRSNMYEEVARLEGELLQAKAERADCRNKLASFKQSALLAAQGKITLKELERELTR